MRIFVHSTDTSIIYNGLSSGYVYGITMNPTIMQRGNISARQLPGLVQQMVGWGANEVHLQVYSDTISEILNDARELSVIDNKRVVVRIPATRNGFAAAAQLTRQNVRVSLTAVYTLRQAMLAHNVGADYVSVFLRRMNDAGTNGLARITEMKQLLTVQQSTTMIMAASMREPVDIVEKLGMLGIQAATITPSILEDMLVSPETEQATEEFRRDAETVLNMTEEIGGH